MKVVCALVVLACVQMASSLSFTTAKRRRRRHTTTRRYKTAVSVPHGDTHEDIFGHHDTTVQDTTVHEDNFYDRFTTVDEGEPTVHVDGFPGALTDYIDYIHPPAPKSTPVPIRPTRSGKRRTTRVGKPVTRRPRKTVKHVDNAFFDRFTTVKHVDNTFYDRFTTVQEESMSLHFDVIPFFPPAPESTPVLIRPTRSGKRRTTRVGKPVTRRPRKTPRHFDRFTTFHVDRFGPPSARNDRFGPPSAHNWWHHHNDILSVPTKSGKRRATRVGKPVKYFPSLAEQENGFFRSSTPRHFDRFTTFHVDRFGPPSARNDKFGPPHKWWHDRNDMLSVPHKPTPTPSLRSPPSTMKVDRHFFFKRNPWKRNRRYGTRRPLPQSMKAPQSSAPPIADRHGVPGGHWKRFRPRPNNRRNLRFGPPSAAPPMMMHDPMMYNAPPSAAHNLDWYYGHYRGHAGYHPFDHDDMLSPPASSAPAPAPATSSGPGSAAPPMMMHDPAVYQPMGNSLMAEEYLLFRSPPPTIHVDRFGPPSARNDRFGPPHNWYTHNDILLIPSSSSSQAMTTTYHGPGTHNDIPSIRPSSRYPDRYPGGYPSGFSIPHEDKDFFGHRYTTETSSHPVPSMPHGDTYEDIFGHRYTTVAPSTAYIDHSIRSEFIYSEDNLPTTRIMEPSAVYIDEVIIPTEYAYSDVVPHGPDFGPASRTETFTFPATMEEKIPRPSRMPIQPPAPIQPSAAVVAPSAAAPKLCWGRKKRSCISGKNIGNKRRNRTLKQCQKECANTPTCKAIEYYKNYGGSRGTFKKGDCQLNYDIRTWGCDGTRHNMDVYYPMACKNRPTPQPSGPPPTAGPTAGPGQCISTANRIQRKGCYNSMKKGRLLVYWRYRIDWKNISEFAANLACACSERAKRVGAEYFGIHYWGECWALERRSMQIAPQGDCILADGKYKSKCTDSWNGRWSQECLADQSFFVYKVLAPGEQPEPEMMI